MVILAVECFVAHQFQLEIMVNMTAVYLFDWSILRLGITLAVTVAIIALLLLFAENNLLGNVMNIYFLYIFAFVSVMIANSLIAITVTLKPTSVYWQSFIVCLLLALSLFPYFASNAYCRSIIFFVTPSHSASIVESYRLMVRQLSTALAFFLASYVYAVVSVVSLAYSVVSFFIIMLLLFWYRKKYFLRLLRGRSNKTEKY